MSVRLYDLFFVMEPSDVRPRLANQPAFKNDFVGLIFALPDDRPLSKGRLHSTRLGTGYGSFFT